MFPTLPRRLGHGLALVILIASAFPALAEQQARLPGVPVAFLADPANRMLTAAIRQDDEALRDLERASPQTEAAQPPRAVLDHAVALLAVGRLSAARLQLGRVLADGAGDGALTQRASVVLAYTLARGGAFAEARAVLDKMCADGVADPLMTACLHVAARIAGLSKDREASLDAVRRLHRGPGALVFPNAFLPRAAEWDCVRVADYVVMKAADASLWGSHDQDLQRFFVRSNLAKYYDVTKARSFGDAFFRLEKAVQFEFEIDNYEAALDWITEYDLMAETEGWQLPIERNGYRARAYFSLGKKAEAQEVLEETSSWMSKVLDDPFVRDLNLLIFAKTFDVAGLEGETLPFLEKIWTRVASRTDVNSKLLAFEAGTAMLRHLSALADLARFEQTRQRLIPIAAQIEAKYPTIWPGKRYAMGWIDLLTARTILTYDPQPERLSGMAAKLSRHLDEARRAIDLTRPDGRQRLSDVPKWPVQADASARDRIARAAAEFQLQLIPLLGDIYAKLGRWDRAVPLLEASYFLTMRESVCGRPLEQVAASVTLLKATEQQGDARAAHDWFEETRACLLASAGQTAQLAQFLARLADRHARDGDLYGAEFALARAVWIERQLGRPHDVDLAEFLHRQAELLHGQGDAGFALGLMEEAEGIALAAPRKDWSEVERRLVERQIAIRADLVASQPGAERAGALLARAFLLSQIWLKDDVGLAVESAARRKELPDERVAALLQRRDELRFQQSIRERQFAAVLGTAGARAGLQLRQDIADDLRRVEAAIAAIDGSLGEKGFDARVPQVALPALRRALARDETLFYFVAGQSDIVRWRIMREGVQLDRLAIGAAQASAMIGALRCGLDASAWSQRPDGKVGCAAEAPRTAAGFDVFQVDFDLTTAHGLYAALFGGADSDAAPSWIIVPSGPLSSLPYGVLVTRPSPTSPSPPVAAAYAEATWLALRHPLTVLPTVAGMAAATKDPPRARSGASRPYVGFGNPRIPGSASRPVFDSCAAEMALDCARVLPRVAFLGAGARVRAEDFSPIPQTACELCAIRRTIGPSAPSDRQDVFLGPDMTRAQVMTLGAPDAATGRSPLQQYRVVHFATHGLMAGQSAVTDQPGLLMSPSGARHPAQRDTILTASDIAQLKLDADWIILSACNTAARLEPGSEAFSGLARAFLQAGARSVLVSHWSVSTNAAVKISTASIAAITRDPGLTRAEAVRRAIAAILEEGRDALPAATVKLHPSYWGPFALISTSSAHLRPVEEGEQDR